MKSLLFVCMAAICLSSCIKSLCSDEDACKDLKKGLIINDENQVKTSIEAIIANLHSTKYTEDNIAALIGSIKSNCSVTASVDCFNCIKTLPSMTEIYLTVGSGATKIVDLSYDDSNTIIVKRLH